MTSAEGHRLRRHLRCFGGQRVGRREPGLTGRVREAITVASSTADDQQSAFSSYGSAVNYGSAVDLYAPGSAITSAWNTGDDATKTASGTSMAAPHVAGAAAVYLADHPDADPAAVAQVLTDGATADAISNAFPGNA